MAATKERDTYKIEVALAKSVLELGYVVVRWFLNRMRNLIQLEL